MPFQPQSLLTAARCVTGWFVGYLISAASSIAYFRGAHINPEIPATPTILALTALYGVAFAILAAWLGASFARKQGRGIGISIALTILTAATVSWAATPGHAHWTQVIALALMAPAAILGGYLRRTR